SFRKAFSELPAPVQRQVREAYRLFQDNPHHPGLWFKQVHPSRPIYSVRIGLHYRALGVRDGDVMVWFWVGSHEQYDRLVMGL
ncbi:MAG: hypothetical protein HY681_03360, partial [Chloroflexi bacterium]|nr:hypothetical protein [Chloroflexota bacterium]